MHIMLYGRSFLSQNDRACTCQEKSNARVCSGQEKSNARVCTMDKHPCKWYKQQQFFDRCIVSLKVQ